MNKYEIIIIIILISIIIGSFIWSFESTKKDLAVREKNREKANKYLDTVLNRASMSTSPEALEMLWNEMYLTASEYNYYQGEISRFKNLRSFIKGKYHGLLKNSEIVSNTFN